jgi:hypothetical protein
MKKLYQILCITIFVGGIVFPSLAGALTIGYYDDTREDWGFSGGVIYEDGGVDPETGLPLPPVEKKQAYLLQAKQWLIDQGHTLVVTNEADAAFLSGVDAFYTGLIGSVFFEEVSAFHDFVNVQGGFLFIQTDWATSTWSEAANTILSSWGIAHDGNYYNEDGTIETGHYTVGASEWVTDPNVVTGFVGGQHSVVTESPADFEVLAKDEQDRVIMGVFDAGAGRSSDVLIATDIDFWSDIAGWQDPRNQALWENIWQGVENQIEPVPEPSTMLLLGSGLVGVLALGRKKFSRR